MNRILGWCIVTIACLAGPGVDGLDLVKDGKPVATIVVPDSADRLTRQAADLLEAVWFEASGARLEIAPESKAQQGAVLVSVGPTRLARTAGLDIERLRDEEFRVRVVGNILYIVGRDLAGKTYAAEGTLRAAIALLRDQFGVRWVVPSPKGLKVPRSSTLRVPDDLVVRPDRPAFEFAMGRFSYHDAQYAHWGKAHRFGAPGVYSCGGHAWTQVYSDDLLRTNLEFVAEIKGRRAPPSGNNPMLCTSHPEFVDRVTRWLEDRFDAGYDIVELGQSDGFDACECGRCNKRFGDFKVVEGKANRCLVPHRQAAMRVKKSRPGKKVMIIAYDITRLPPRTFPAMPDNVVVELAPPGADAKLAWAGKARTYAGYVYTWGEYFTAGLGPNGRSIEELARTMREWHQMGVRGLYYCGGDYNWAMLGPQYYVAASLQSDINADTKRLLSEYCETLYGNAARTMQTFFERLYDRGRTYIYFAETVPPLEETPELVYTLTYPPETLIEWMKLFDQARQQAAGDDRALNWIRATRIGFDHIRHIASAFHAYRAYKLEPSVGTIELLARHVNARTEFNGYVRGLAEKEPLFAANYFLNHARFVRSLDRNGRGRAALAEPFNLDINKLAEPARTRP